MAVATGGAIGTAVAFSLAGEASDCAATNDTQKQIDAITSDVNVLKTQLADSAHKILTIATQ